MAIWGFFGQLGDGKDTTANYFLKLKTEKGRKVVSHCQLSFPYIYMPIDQIFDKCTKDTLFFQDKILYISEFHLIMESRRSSSSVNVDFSEQILIQLGKIDCDLFYTSQIPSQIDLRIKEMQKYFFFCKKVFREHGLYEMVEKDGKRVSIHSLVDWDRRIVKHPITGKLIPFDIDLQILIQSREIETQTAILPWEILETLFSRFETREIIKFDRAKYLKK